MNCASSRSSLLPAPAQRHVWFASTCKFTVALVKITKHLCKKLAEKAFSDALRRTASASLPCLFPYTPYVSGRVNGIKRYLRSASDMLPLELRLGCFDDSFSILFFCLFVQEVEF